jgi:riboflavin kinase/FMN adenylyltransferase
MHIEQELANIHVEGETLLTVGVFDGIHLGHQYLLRTLIQQAEQKSLTSGVVTFNPHPQSILHPQEQAPWIITMEDRIKLLQQMNVKIIAVLSFTHKLAELSAKEFVHILQQHLKMRGLIVGPNSSLGRKREGNAELLHSLGDQMGFTVDIVPPFTIDGKTVSSTAIRQSLSQGDVATVKKLMGHAFTVNGKVVSANKRGYKLGFPTANLDVAPNRALPCNGVYATISHVDGKQFASATNIGTQPTFGDGQIQMETHLVGYKGNLLGKSLEVTFVQRLRDEKQFASPQELQIQIMKDIEQVKIVERRKAQ